METDEEGRVMGVYISPVFTTKRSKKWPYTTACHVVADTSLELDDWAYSMRLQVYWKQHPLTPKEHYDLVASRRDEAIRCGAEARDHRFIARLMGEKAAREALRRAATEVIGDA